MKETNTFFCDAYDVAIIGGGHAGCEAALAAARLGCRTIMFAINLDSIANMPCNPSIGGSAKGQLVCEIDALGGEMGCVADRVFIQSRMLNTGRGAAVNSLRVQADRRAYQETMKLRLEQQQNLHIKQAEIIDITPDKENPLSWLLTTSIGAIYRAGAVVIATGTFLRGRIIIGDHSYDGGPDGLFAANALSQSLKTLGLPLVRFKTGTPPRVLKNSIDLSRLEVQHGDDDITPFSFTTTSPLKNKAVCYLAYTNEKTHEIIRQNLHRSPLYAGEIKGIGPRYCPCIEDKVVRFASKDRHQLFIEPMGLHTDEMYIQGLSSSLPEDVQLQVLRSIDGFENAHMMRPAYAIEYDCVDPTFLSHSLEFKPFPRLFGAGQFNGSSGYEEAAAQGLVAGINAAHAILGKEPFILRRDEAYIGVLIDDLVLKGVDEPYRMMTARSEFRLLLRQDNADSRLTPVGFKLGLISPKRYNAFLGKKSRIDSEIARINKTILSPSAANDALLALGSTPVSSGVRLCELIRRPELSYSSLAIIDPERPELSRAESRCVEISVKYEGYISRQAALAEQTSRLYNKALPKDLNFFNIDGLRLEAKEKLSNIRPQTIGQASRISGVNPADINVLLVFLSSQQNPLH